MRPRRATANCGRGGQRGYVLILTVGVLAMLMLAAAAIASGVSLAQDMAREELADVERERALDETLARALLVVASWPRSSEGFVGQVTVVPDGRWYDSGNGVYVSFQDARGMLNLRAAPRAWIERLLQTYGLDPSQIERAIDSLDDYEDSDSLVRLNGAEADQYAGTSMPLPRNGRLKVVEELRRILGWGDVESLWAEDPVSDHVAVGGWTGLNPNAASWRVLAAVAGLSPEEARQLRERRSAGSDVDLVPLLKLQQGADDPFSNTRIVGFPASTTYLTLVARGRTEGRRYEVTVTPESSLAPWSLGLRGAVRFQSAVMPGDAQKLPDATQFRIDPAKEREKLPF